MKEHRHTYLTRLRWRAALVRTLALFIATGTTLAYVGGSNASEWTGSFNASYLFQNNYVDNWYDDFVTNPVPHHQVTGQGLYYGTDAYFYTEIRIAANGTATRYTEVADVNQTGTGPDSGAAPPTDTGAQTVYAEVDIDLSNQWGSDVIHWWFTTSVDSDLIYGDQTTQFFGYPEITVGGYDPVVLSIQGGANFSDAPNSWFTMTWQFVIPY